VSAAFTFVFTYIFVCEYRHVNNDQIHPVFIIHAVCLYSLYVCKTRFLNLGLYVSKLMGICIK